jgi:hypothetical protein
MVVRSVPWWGVASSAAVPAVQVGLLNWFGVEVLMRGHQIGLAERVLALTQVAWLLAVVLTCWSSEPATEGLGGGLADMIGFGRGRLAAVLSRWHAP